MEWTREFDDFVAYFHAAMTTGAEALRQEAQRLRSLADRMEAFAKENERGMD